MIRIAAVLFAAIVSDVPALADERISRAIEGAFEMFVAGRNGACPNLRFNMGALSHQLGSLLGAYGGGLLFDALGSYDLALQLGVGMGSPPARCRSSPP